MESNTSSSESDEDSENDEPSQQSHMVKEILSSPDDLHKLLEYSSYNWFEFLENLQNQLQKDVSCVSKPLFDSLSKCLSKEEMQLTSQSYSAFCVTGDEMYEQERIARAVNGEVVSDSESDDPEEFAGVSEVLSTKGKALIQKKRLAIMRRAKRKQQQIIAEKRFLSRKVSQRVSKILQDCPDIGETIESFVQEHSVGADAWRRTGVLTFDGNVKLKDKVAYEKIRRTYRIHTTASYLMDQ